jgi:hypothetical protein
MAGNNIYVQGSYIDVHDNENVYLSVDKAEVNMKGQEAGEHQSREERVAAGMRHVVDRNLVQKKQDWAAIYQVLLDEEIYEKLTKTDFVKKVQTLGFTPELVPSSSSNIDKVMFSKASKYPAWRITGFADEETDRLTALASAFLTFYRS